MGRAPFVEKLVDRRFGIPGVQDLLREMSKTG
jgi:hypothetical protein